MNFKNFYSKTEQKIIDTALSLWATGEVEMQQYLREIFHSEKLLAKPVFQNMFPWEPAKNVFRGLSDIFDQSFINRLDNIKNPEFRFPSDRNPYLHQVKSWKTTLIDKKSILVTTGTGSGKTECFMLPVLQDIYRENPNQTGINAIFLYPLNALIGSQKKRMHAWCSALGNINYGIYNGNTEEDVRNQNQQEALPEIISRKNLRERPPQVLFTNPTMLEYMLVRDKDTQLLQNSRGKLRWILLDEAHTLTGSKAAEIALLIRRVIDAFDVDVENIRFAVTSATVGNGNDDALKQFMADLCGIKIESIEIINGRRILPEFDKELINNQPIPTQKILELRNSLYQNTCLDSDSISEIIEITDLNDQLNCIDVLAEISDNGQPVLPVRGHFFARNINGVFSCTNPNCNIHTQIPSFLYGTLTTIAKKNCNCGYPLLELISCKNCGTYMLEGEIAKNVISQSSKQNTDFFDVYDSDLEDVIENVDVNEDQSKFILAKRIPNKEFITENLFPIEIGINGEINIQNAESLYYQLHDTTQCPYCRESLKSAFHFRLSSTFLNRLMSDVVLEQTENANPISNQMLWSGKKYISFTDSRQITAKISALINIDSETYWLRSQVYHKLSKKIKENSSTILTEDQRIAKMEMLRHFNEQLTVTFIPDLIIEINRLISNIEAELNISPPSVKSSKISWREMLEDLARVGTDFSNLFYHNIRGNIVEQGNGYLNALLYNEFARRFPRDRSLENLGMVKLVYPQLDNIIRPKIAIELNINQEDWRNLIKIALDFQIRYKCHYSLPLNVKGMASSKHRSIAVFSNNSTLSNIQKWPKFDRNLRRQNRLSLLVCAGLGFKDKTDIDAYSEDLINEILENLWIDLRVNFLTLDDNEGGYKLNLEEKVAFELTDKLWLCPVKKRLLDTNFRGYSPWISGSFTLSNIESFLVGEEIQFPLFPYPFNLDNENILNSVNTEYWFEHDSGIKILKDRGLWNSLHERIINFKPLYLAGEHSAQQNPKRLAQLEEKFQDGKINILSCSTTMEMGVDIGGISAVVMSNVPPSPTSYLQRTGRAGRRRENKSLAFTICAANPIGSNVISNPGWALNHLISPPMLAFSSRAVVLRHLNAFMFGKFIQQTLAGISIKENNEEFFGRALPGSNLTAAQSFRVWLLGEEVNRLFASIAKIIFNTPLNNNTPISLVGLVYSNFEVILNTFNRKRYNFDVALEGLLNMNGYSINSPAYKAINFQKNQFLHKNLLAYLSEEGFLPAGGIPTGIVDFNNTNIRDLQQNKENLKLPSYHITRALSEYAPGMELVIDGWTYKSAGISLKNNWGGEATKRAIQHCNTCGYEHIIETNDSIQSICPHCDNPSLKGIIAGANFTEIIEPVGFAVDLYGEKTREISEISSVQYVEPLLIGVEPWSDPSHPVFDYRDSKENAEILHYNYGKGEGYTVCLECGRADSNPSALVDHKRLRGGKNENNNQSCGGNNGQFAIRNNVLLVGRFQTDFFEFRCKDSTGSLIRDETTLYSLGQVISKSLAVYLGIEEQEVDFGIKKYGGFSSIFLYDTAKGGAGYVSQCANFFDQVCIIALASLKGCTCRSACTKCLIDRGSQFHLEKLNRHNAIEWLERVVNLEIPQEISNFLTNYPQKLLSTIKNDWAKMLQKKQIQKVWMAVDYDQIDSWEDEYFLLLNQLKLNEVKINLVFRGEPNNLSLDQKLTLIQAKSWAKLFYVNNFMLGSLEWIGKVKLDDGQLFDYFGNDYHSIIGNNWGNSAKNYIYKQVSLDNFLLLPYEFIIEENQANVFEVFISAPSKFILSDSIYNEFEQCLSLEVKKTLSNKFKSKNVKVVYSDRYLMTPFGGLLLIQFLNKMKVELNFQIMELSVQLKALGVEGISEQYITDKFISEKSREEFIKRIANDTEISDVKVQLLAEIPHYRFMSFEFENEKSITIRPDAGIEHGWFAQDKYMDTNSIKGDSRLAIQQKLNKKLLYSLVFNN